MSNGLPSSPSLQTNNIEKGKRVSNTHTQKKARKFSNDQSKKHSQSKDLEIIHEPIDRLDAATCSASEERLRFGSYAAIPTSFPASSRGFRAKIPARNPRIQISITNAVKCSGNPGFFGREIRKGRENTRKLGFGVKFE